MKQVAELKRTWNLAPVFWTVPKISEKYGPCLYLSTDWVWWVNGLWFKRYIEKCTVSRTNIYNDTTDLVKHRFGKTWWLRIQKIEEGWYTTVNCPQNYEDFDQSTSLEVRANFLDISKDFDKVRHKELLYKNLKLSKFGNLQNLCFQIL